MIVNGQKFSTEIINRIQKFISDNPGISRRQLSLEVCRWLDWRNENGKLKDMSCRVALLKLHRKALIRLPEHENQPKIKFRKGNNIIKLEEVPKTSCNLSDIAPIEIILIRSADSKVSKIWNTLLDLYHYLGSGPLCGAQLRYLIYSEKIGYIGGFSFSSAAWRLASRDNWIGWDDAARKNHLDKVICNSRFLIHPHLRVKNLASHALSLIGKRVVRDWYERYGIKPILMETFVNKDRFQGTSYKASNWHYIGETKGRGRQDVNNKYSEPVKDIYIYELDKKGKEKLCDGRVKQKVKEPEPADWAEEEFGQCKLGDKRRINRLFTIARDFYAKPEANIPQACGSRAKTKATYRFFDESDNTMNKILESHCKRTIGRISKEKIVLSVQDTTCLKYNTHPATENLGPIGTTKDGSVGLILHDTMAFNLDGTPLGLLDAQCWARDPKDFGKSHRRYELPIEQKESSKWLKSFQATQKANKSCPETMIVSVGDRESDIYELFELAVKQVNGPKLLIRADRDRLLSDKQTHLWDYIKSQPLSGIRKIAIPKRGNRAHREAKLEIRFSKVTLKPPKRKPKLPELEVWAILAEEIDCPEGAEPLKWVLITTISIDSYDDAIEKLDWYALRFLIEVYHRTLKSGCKIEQRQLGKADRIESCLAIDMVVAWRIFNLTKLGRETPDVPCTVFFDDSQWKTIVAYKTQNPIPSEKVPSLREAIHMVAGLGGFLGRKSDGEPGTQTLWLGLQRLDDLTEMWKTCINFFAPNHLRPPPTPCTQ